MPNAIVAELDAAIDAIAGIDVHALADDDLHDVVIRLHRAGQRLAGVAAPLLARWDARGVWRSDGSRSARCRLARDVHTSASTASVALRRARALPSMPVTADAVTAGTVSMDHVDVLARADRPHRHHLFARDEATLIDQCATLRHDQAVRALTYWIQRADGECDDSAEPCEPISSLHASTTFEGTVRLDGTLAALDGTVVLDELTRLERQQYLADEAAGLARPHRERLAAALTEMARRSAVSSTGAARPLFTVVLGDDAFAHLCELANGTVIAPDLLVPSLGAADLEVLLFDGPFTAVATSTARSFTGRLRRVIEARDRHCQHPSGCGVPAPACDVDHIVPWDHGGPTTQFNGRSGAARTTAIGPSTITAHRRTRRERSPCSTRSAPGCGASTGTSTHPRTTNR